MSKSIYSNDLKIKNQAKAFGEDILVQVLDWITSNFYPDEIYEVQELKERCASNWRVQDVYHENSIITYVERTFNPDEVFPESKLKAWAEENGYKKE